MRIRRRGHEQGRTVAAFLGVGTGLLLLAAIFGVYARDPLNALLRTAADPIARLLIGLGVNLADDTAFARYVIDPLFLGVVLSGPLLIVSSALGLLLGHFTLEITPRAEVLCADSASSTG